MNKNERNVQLIRQYRETGDIEFRNEIVCINMGMISSIASHWKKAIHGRMEYNDLVQEGVLALMKTVESYDIRLGGAKFTSYAYTAIYRDIGRAITQKSHIVRVPDNLKYSTTCVSLGENWDLLTNELIPPDAAESRELAENISLAFRFLPSHKAEIMRMAFGLDGQPKMTQEEIGRKLNKVQQCVRFHIKTSIEAMRKNEVLASLAS